MTFHLKKYGKDGKKIGVFGVLLLLSFCIVPTVFAAEKIEVFVVEIEILENSNIRVTENITYDFGSQNRHGIFREIPIQYDSPIGKRSLDIQVSDVLRDALPEPFSSYRDSGNTVIKIGNPNATITGSHVYEIQYLAKNAINYFDDIDELYWNVLGHDWDVVRENVSVTISLPEGKKITQSHCYTGIVGSTAQDCEIFNSGTTTIATTDKIFQPGEDITISVGFPKGIVAGLSVFDRIKIFFRKGLPIGTPVAVLIIAVLFWFRHGRDPKGRGTIITEYEPPVGLKPLLVGFIHKPGFRNKYIIAAVIYLAQQGFLQIKKTKKKRFLFSRETFEVTLLREPDATLEEYQQKLLDILFTSQKVGEVISTSNLKDSMRVSRAMQSFITIVDKKVKTQGFYTNTPAWKKFLFLALPLVLLSTLQVLFVCVILVTVISTASSLLVVLFFGNSMRKRTQQGVLLKEHIQGFKIFLEVTEKERYAFHNAPEKSPEQFMQFLPFAIALGVEKAWAEQFRDMNIEPPSWYVGVPVGSFAAADFVSGFHSFTKSFASAYTSSTSGSAGGGFSGGGAGGGGGGSW
jgi:uncharacterized membrane protein